MHYIEKTLAGVPVVFVPMADAASVTVEILVKAGSLYEDRSTNGLSHFLEHMFFKGGRTYTSPKAVVETIDAIGGEFNAFTGNDYAGYYVKSAPEHVYLALDVLGDMMVHSTFPVEEVEKETGVVIQEIAMYDDMPESVARSQWQEKYYGDNPYGRSILGPKETVASFTQEALFAHKNRLYTKDNMTIVIAGRILDQDRIESIIENLFVDLPATTHESREKPTLPLVFPHDTRDMFDKQTHQNHLVMGAPGVGRGHSLEYATKLLGLIMGGTMSSRLFQEIREKRGLCYYVGCSHSVHPDHGVFMIRAGLSKEHYAGGVEAIKNELRKATQHDITSDELAKAQSNMLGRVQMGIETSDEMADFVGAQYLLYGKIDSLDTILTKYQSVTMDDIHAACSYLNPQNRYGLTVQ